MPHRVPIGARSEVRREWSAAGVVDQLDPAIAKRGIQQRVLLGPKHSAAVHDAHRLRLHTHLSHGTHGIAVVEERLEIQRIVGNALRSGGGCLRLVDRIATLPIQWVGTEHEAHLPQAVTHARCASPPGPPRRSHRGRPSAGVTSRPASGRWAGSWWSAQSGAHDKTGAVRRRAGYRRQAGPVLSCAPAGPTPARIPADHRGHASPPEPTCPGRRGPMATIPAFLTHLVQ